jgi:hypothetical protein
VTAEIKIVTREIETAETGEREADVTGTEMIEIGDTLAMEVGITPGVVNISFHSHSHRDVRSPNLTKLDPNQIPSNGPATRSSKSAGHCNNLQADFREGSRLGQKLKGLASKQR